MGISWAHVLGDACACIQFLNTFSRLYQGLLALESLPVFPRRLWHRENIDPTYLPMMKHLTESLTMEEILQRTQDEEKISEQINLHFHDDDLLIAYIIITLNRLYLKTNEDLLIHHTNIIINYRGVSDRITPTNLIANCTFRMISENFSDSHSLSSVVQSIARSNLSRRIITNCRPSNATFSF